MPTMRAVEVSAPGAPLTLVEREVPSPAAGQARIKVQACGICHSDMFTKEGLWPGIQFPRVPGHEIAGVVDAVGTGVNEWKPGQRVGVGWYGGHCGHCDRCRRGDFVLCRTGLVPGISYDGGYAEYLVAPAAALVHMPDELSDVDAAPLLCAGITTFNALRNSGARAGDLVAVLGLGGLGHLGVQFAAKLGFDTVAIARGKEKEPLARQLGARHYIDSTAHSPAEALMALGGASVILATVTSGKAMSAVLGGLAVDGTLIILGVSEEPVEVSTTQFVMGRHSVQGWPSGTASDSEDTLAFSARTGVKAMVERFPLVRAADAYDRMMSGRARFRVVLTTGA